MFYKFKMLLDFPSGFLFRVPSPLIFKDPKIHVLRTIYIFLYLHSDFCVQFLFVAFLCTTVNACKKKSLGDNHML